MTFHIEAVTSTNICTDFAGWPDDIFYLEMNYFLIHSFIHSVDLFGISSRGYYYWAQQFDIWPQTDLIYDFALRFYVGTSLWACEHDLKWMQRVHTQRTLSGPAWALGWGLMLCYTDICKAPHKGDSSAVLSTWQVIEKKGLKASKGVRPMTGPWKEM